jgi:hypothetical protein
MSITHSAGYSQQSGVGVLTWGTDGLWSTAIVDSMTQENEGEVIYVENGTGQKAARVLIKNGNKWTYSILLNDGTNPPAFGTVATLVVDQAGYGSTGGRVVATSAKYTRKAVAMMDVTVEYTDLIAG